VSILYHKGIEIVVDFCPSTQVFYAFFDHPYERGDTLSFCDCTLLGVKTMAFEACEGIEMIQNSTSMVS
jgi:hypothetical protein